MRRTLILVDVQNGFLHNADNQVMVQKIHQLLNEQLFDRVIATRYVNTAGSNIIRLMGWDKLLTAAEQTIPPESVAPVGRRILTLRSCAWSTSSAPSI